MIITVRDVEEDDFKEFRAAVVSKGIKTGTALSQAMREWAGKPESKKRKGKSLFDLKPVDWGKGSEQYSSRFDEYLYGGKK